MVAEDSPNMGRAGTVQRVFQGRGWALEFHIFEHVSAKGKAGGTLGARKNDMEVQRTDAPKAVPQFLDWRKLTPEHRSEL